MRAKQRRARAACGGAADGQSLATAFALAQWTLLAGIFDAELRAAGREAAADALRCAVLALADVWPGRIDRGELAEACARLRAELAVRPGRLH